MIVFSTFGIFFAVLWPRVFYWENGNIVAGWIGIWGDWAAHASYTSSFAYKPVSEWFVRHPLYYDSKFIYTFGADFISSLFLRATGDLVFSLVVPSMITTGVMLYMLLYFYTKALISPKQAFLAMLLFFFNGGLGFIYFFQDVSTHGLLSSLAYPPREYTHISEKYIEWINITTSQLLPQRAMLLGIPIMLILLCVIYSWWKTSFKNVKLWKIVATGLLVSTLVVVHMHTLIALVVICSVFFLFDIRNWKKWVTFAIAAAIPTIVLYTLLFNGSIASDFIRWHVGWIGAHRDDGTNFLLFTLWNFGIFLPFAALSTLYLKMYRNPLVVSGIILFILTQLISFQPNDWDNTKIILWAYTLLSIPVVRMLAVLSKKGVLAKICVVILIFTMTFAGALDVWYMFRVDKHNYILYHKEDVELARNIVEFSDPTDVILTGDMHSHWVPSLTGRQILSGYKGWMWTYGIKRGQVEDDVDRMFLGGKKADELLKKYNITWVVIGKQEQEDFTANETYFYSKYPLVFLNSYYRVYAIR